ncbi:MAG: hypothetical protein MUF15_24840, partial [Acidobacteria bacterium]|nr:hypothetical protein [Acidobacteriota bacterium]
MTTRIWLRNNLFKILIFNLLMLGIFAGSLPAEIVIKIGTIVPMRSPWMDELRKMDVEWRRIT